MHDIQQAAYVDSSGNSFYGVQFGLVSLLLGVIKASIVCVKCYIIFKHD